MSEINKTFRIVAVLVFAGWIIQSPFSGWWILPAWFLVAD